MVWGRESGVASCRRGGEREKRTRDAGLCIAGNVYGCSAEGGLAPSHSTGEPAAMETSSLAAALRLRLGRGGRRREGAVHVPKQPAVGTNGLGPSLRPLYRRRRVSRCSPFGAEGDRRLGFSRPSTKVQLLKNNKPGGGWKRGGKALPRATRARESVGSFSPCHCSFNAAVRAGSLSSPRTHVRGKRNGEKKAACRCVPLTGRMSRLAHYRLA